MSQRYLELAMEELQVHETAGDAATERIIEYDKHTALKATSDEVAWCSSFANFIVDTAGDSGTHSAAARSWLDWGRVLDTPVPGCVVVIDRHDDTNPHAAHVTFFTCFKDKDHIECIGGNQGDCVKMSVFPKTKVLGYRDTK